MLFTRRNATTGFGCVTLLAAPPRAASAQDNQRGAPTVGFYFGAKFVDSPVEEAVAFQEVGGLSQVRVIDRETSGGENRYASRPPRKMRYQNIVLKRGVCAADSEFVNWCKVSLESGLAASIVTRNVEIFLRDAEGSPMIAWELQSAWPVSWSVPSIVKGSGDLLIEDVQLSYQWCTRRYAQPEANE